MKKIGILKYIITSIITLICYITLSQPIERTYKINVIADQTTKNNEKHFLIEDFNNSLNNQYWNIIEQGNNYNNELQYYQPANITSQNSLLTITAKKEALNNHQYTSGQLTTKDKFEFLYGKVIFKIKPAVGQGLLTAIWLLPADDSLFPEIDIIEILGNNSQEVWTGIHYKEGTDKKSSFKTYINKGNDFTTYELDWNKDEIKWYINGNLTFSSKVGIPNQKMYLIINLAIGGDWPKNPNDTIFPRDLLIDYIMIIPEQEQ
jgi:beta-glucanase (GH16 family)